MRENGGINLKLLNLTKSLFWFPKYLYVYNDILMSSVVICILKDVCAVKLSDVLCRPVQGLAALKA